MQLNKKTVLALSLGLIVASATDTLAQTAGKTGYINLPQLIRLMPETQAAYNTLQQYEKELNVKGQAMLDAYSQKVNALKASKAPMNDSVKQVVARDLQQTEQQLEAYHQEVTQRVAIREQELTAPLVAKAQEALRAVAQEQGYTTVYNDANSQLLVKPAGDDLLPAVRQKLGLPAAGAAPSMGGKSSGGTKPAAGVKPAATKAKPKANR